MWKVISREPLNRNKIPRDSKFSFCCLLLRRGPNNLQRRNGKPEKGDSGVRASQQGTEHVRWLEKRELGQGLLKEESGSFETNWIHFHLNQSLFYSDIPLFSLPSLQYFSFFRERKALATGRGSPSQASRQVGERLGLEQPWQPHAPHGQAASRARERSREPRSAQRCAPPHRVTAADAASICHELIPLSLGRSSERNGGAFPTY